MDDVQHFKETSLPKKEPFYSKLNDENITDEEYQRAKDVYKKYDCKNLGEYHDLYVRTDILLLAGVFEHFRAIYSKQYGLDRAHYYTSPGLSLDAFLKHSNVRLDLLTDYDMHLFIENGLRGGMSMVSQIYSKANNPYLKDYDRSKPTSYIHYLDANDLYGWAMNQPLPIGKFKWLKNDDINLLDIESIDVDLRKGYILEVDLEYSK